MLPRTTNRQELLTPLSVALMFFQRLEWRRERMFASSKRGVGTRLSSPTLAATRRASTRQSLRTSMESLIAPLSSTCKNLELPSPLTCKRRIKPSCQSKIQERRRHFCSQRQRNIPPRWEKPSKGVREITSRSFLQGEAGEDAVHPRGA